jgi:cytochrome c oxidase cbb3-type subunit III
MTSRRLAKVMFVGVAIVVWSPIAAPAQTSTGSLDSAGPADLAAGQRVFDSQCAWCHGAGGTGGTGPDLRRTSLRRAATDTDLLQLIRNGTAAEMPAFGYALTDRSVWQTAAYVRSLGRTPATPIPGDAQRGASLYETNGCAVCHVINGRGGVLGPELTSIGALRGSAYLRESIVTPEAAHPRAFLMVRAVTKNGTEIRGIRVVEDVFWVDVRDLSGVVHTLSKSELSTLERLPNATLMPSYGSKLSAPDLVDLVAYLSTLRGAR